MAKYNDGPAKNVYFIFFSWGYVLFVASFLHFAFLDTYIICSRGLKRFRILLILLGAWLIKVGHHLVAFFTSVYLLLLYRFLRHSLSPPLDSRLITIPSPIRAIRTAPQILPARAADHIAS